MSAMRWELALALGITALGCGSSETAGGDGNSSAGNSGSGNSGSGNSGSGNSGSGAGAGSGGSNGTGTGTSAACAGLQTDGHAIGDIAENWSLPNELLEMVALHDFCGKVVFFEEGSQW